MLNCDVFPIDGTSFQQDKAELIVIGSLIDDVASLGGLARSCEIFNASRLILGESFSQPLGLFLFLLKFLPHAGVSLGTSISEEIWPISKSQL